MRRIRKYKKDDLYKLFTGIITDPIKISFAVFLIASSLIIMTTLLYGYYSDKFRENLLVEAHGTLLDILLLGVFAVWLQQKGNKLKDNKRYIDEIDDFRGWDDETAARKIRGNIRRLNSNGVTSINLSNCCLKNMDLSGAVLSKSDFWGTDLTNTDLSECILNDCNFEETIMGQNSFRGAWLQDSRFIRIDASEVDFREACLDDVVLEGVILRDVDCFMASFKNAKITNSTLNDVSFWKTNLEAVDFSGTCMTGTHFREASLLNVKGLDFKRFENCSLWMAQIDDSVKSVIEEERPELLNEPEDEGW